MTDEHLSITVTVQCYGELQKLCGAPARELQLNHEAHTADDAIAALAARFPQAAGRLEKSACADGERLIGRGQMLDHGAVIALIPPVSGG